MHQALHTPMTVLMTVSDIAGSIPLMKNCHEQGEILVDFQACINLYVAVLYYACSNFPPFVKLILLFLI